MAAMTWIVWTCDRWRPCSYGLSIEWAGRALIVRLACVDAPVTAQNPYGMATRRYLQQRLPVGLELTLDVKTTDRYGRGLKETGSDAMAQELLRLGHPYLDSNGKGEVCESLCCTDRKGGTETGTPGSPGHLKSGVT